MFRTIFAAGMSALLMSGASYAADPPTVKSIAVTADLDAVQNRQAAEYWGGLSEDLKNAIAAQLSNQIDEDGVEIKVDINTVELSNGFSETNGLADTKLVGRVKYDSSDSARFQVIDFTVDVNQALPFIPAGTVLTSPVTDAKIYYDAMVATFAKSVAENLK